MYREVSHSNGPDILREPNAGYKVALAPKHPVQLIETTGRHEAEALRLELLNAVYGRHAVENRIRMLEAVSQQRRLPGTGLKSSMLSYDLVAGTEDRIEMSEFPYIESAELGPGVGTRVVCEQFGSQ